MSPPASRAGDGEAGDPKVIPRDPRAGAVFGVVVGVVVGLLTAVVAVPEHRDTVGLPGAPGVDTGVIGRPPVSGPGGRGVADGAAGADVDGAAAGDVGGGPGAGEAADSGSAGAAGADASQEAGHEPSGNGAPSALARGVQASSIKVGIAYPDLSAFRALGADYDSGDQVKQWQAVVEGWRRDGVLPVHGRDIELVFRSFNILSAQEQRAACVALVQDAKVFVVVATWFFGVGMECVSRELATPLLTQGDPMAIDAFYRRMGPGFFTIAMSTDRMFRNWIHWASARGLLEGRRIGLYSGTDALSKHLVASVESQLQRFGQRPVVKVATDAPATGGPQDVIAAQRFQAERVDLALLMVSSIAQGNFMRQADTQGYRPAYIDNDFGSATSNAAASTKPPSQYDGSWAMTQTTNGDAGANRPVAPQAETCVSNYERYAGARRPQRETAEWGYILLACDLGRVLLAGLRHAGRGLDHASFVGGLEAIRGMAMDRHSPVTFTAEKHHGVDQQRTIQWRRSCACWATETDFAPLWSP